VYRVDQYNSSPLNAAAFRLVPLIYSAGRDETFGIRLVKPYVTWVGLPNNQNNPPSSLPKLSPYKMVSDPDAVPPDNVYLGTMNPDGTATDNIHTHMLGLR
jgi:hypothetical protein